MQLDIIKKEIDKLKVDAIVSFSEQTRLWLTEFNSSDGILVLTKEKQTLLIDGRYFEKASKEAKNVEVVLLNKDSVEKLKDNNFKSIGIEENYLTIAGQKRIKKMFNVDKFVGFNAQQLRIKKSESEIENIRIASDISLRALNNVKKVLKPGMTENDVKALLSYEQMKLGGYKDSFDPIIVSGARGSLPHGNPSDKKIKEGELITIDFGTIYNGYHSDITRTFWLGKLKDKELIEMYEVLKEAQMLGKKAVKAGVTTNEIDKVCRDYITEKGYGKYFVHSTGHGLGIDVHELPNVTGNKELNTVLEPGMIITVEPGIYIPSVGGIRIEDDVLVTKDGHEVLSKIKGEKND